MTSLRDERRDLRKQIGCMNGFFQIFDRQHFISGRRISSKRLLQGGQQQMEQQYATKSVMEKGVEMHKEKPRNSTESSRASFSSSSCSSTFSSLDFNRAIQPEALSRRQVSIPESPSLTQGISSSDLRDVVKNSMHRAVRSVSIKPQNSDERRGTAMKHVDSPRPLQHSKTEKPKATGQGGVVVPRALDVQEVARNSRDGRLALPRFSYDGRESREVRKSAMKHKELPRLSLDSKTNSMKTSESRLHFLGRVESDKCSHVLQMNQEPGSNNGTSSVVARLMGLDAFPEESRTPTIKSSSCVKEASTADPPHALPSSKPQTANPARKPTTYSRIPVEPAPWRQQDSSQGSPKTASKSRKAANQTSVYGEMEKRITELEFKKSGKDLRALKQILESMQKTRARMEEDQSCLHQNAELSKWKKKDNKTLLQPMIKEPCSPHSQQLDSVVVSKSAKHLSNLQTRTPKYQSGSSVHSQKAKNLTPENRNVKTHTDHLPSASKKTSWSACERDRVFTTTPRVKFEDCTTPGRSCGTSSPRLQQNPLRVEAGSGRIRNHGTKKLTEKGPRNRKNRVKSKDQHLSDEAMSEISSGTRYSSYQGDTASVVSESNSQSETEVTTLGCSINTNTRQDKNLLSTARGHTMLEQPSPISVLDSTFDCEDSPSPVKKISTVFQENCSQSPDEEKWCPQNLDHLIDCTRLNHSFKYNQKLESMRNSAQELTWLNKELDEAATDHSLNPDYRYINKILFTSGLLKDSSFIPTTEKLFSSHHLINPDMFHVLEQTEDIKEAVNDKRIQRKMIFDLVDEILVRKITSSRVYTVGKKQTSPQGLMEEVHSEMERLSRLSHCNLDEEDEMARLLGVDMKHESEDWVDYRSEAPALVLDIERQIFKDLINEVITGAVMDGRDWPKRHCRKLFGK